MTNSTTTSISSLVSIDWCDHTFSYDSWWLLVAIQRNIYDKWIFHSCILKLKLSRMVQSSLVTLIYCSNQKGISIYTSLKFFFFFLRIVVRFASLLRWRELTSQICASTTVRKNLNSMRLHKIILSFSKTYHVKQVYSPNLKSQTYDIAVVCDIMYSQFSQKKKTIYLK